jgi:hypothetical protein
LVYAGKVAYSYKGTMPANTSIVLDEGTLGIAGWAFYECSGLTSITIPASVRSISFEAFQDIDTLKTVTFESGSNLQIIGPFAFYSCDGLTSINLPKNLTTIGVSAFEKCENLTTIGNTNATKLEEIEQYAKQLKIK